MLNTADQKGFWSISPISYGDESCCACVVSFVLPCVGLYLSFLYPPIIVSNSLVADLIGLL